LRYVYPMVYQFQCNKELTKPEYKANFLVDDSTIVFTMTSKDGCGINLTLLSYMKKFGIITGIVFAAIGLVMILFGVKIYKEWVIVLVPLLIGVVGFQIYM